MEVTVSPAAFDDKPVMRRLMELYMYDLSEFTQKDVDAHGEFGYRYLDHYWDLSEPPDRHPFFIRIDGALAGFALVREKPDRCAMAEFFIMRRYRRGGVGEIAARRVFEMFPGRWEVFHLRTNGPASTFWPRIIGALSGGQIELVEEPDFIGRRFDVRAPAAGER